MYNETRFTRVVKDDAELGAALLNKLRKKWKPNGKDWNFLGICKTARTVFMFECRL